MWTEVGFEVLHADWPAYPLGRGYKAALAVLSDYPQGTSFYPLDSIDMCTLFLAGDQPDKDPLSRNRLHVAIWDDDLRECSRMGFLEGLTDLQETFLQYSSDAITLTRKGHDGALINELTFNLHPRILGGVEDLLYSGRFGTAIREASILLEEALRSLVPTASSDYGQRLVDPSAASASRSVGA